MFSEFYVPLVGGLVGCERERGANLDGFLGKKRRRSLDSMLRLLRRLLVMVLLLRGGMLISSGMLSQRMWHLGLRVA